MHLRIVANTLFPICINLDVEEDMWEDKIRVCVGEVAVVFV